MSVRLFRRSLPRMHLNSGADSKLCRQDIRPAFRSNRYSYRGSGCEVSRALRPEFRRPFGQNPRACFTKSKAPKRKIQGHREGLLQRAYGNKAHSDFLPTRRALRGPYSNGYHKARPLGEGLRPNPKAFANNRRPRRFARDRTAPCFRGHTIQKPRQKILARLLSDCLIID